MREKVLVGVHADDSSDDESSSQVSSYALGEHFDDKNPMDWSRFNFLLGVRCLYQASVSAAYYPEKAALGASTWPAGKLKAWLTTAVSALAENMLYHSGYEAESARLFQSFAANHRVVINALVEDLIKNPRVLAQQLRQDKKLFMAIQASLKPLHDELARFIREITEADVTAPGPQALSFSDISDVAEFRGLIMQEVFQFLCNEGLMRDDGRVALTVDRVDNEQRLAGVALNEWQTKCVGIARWWHHPNTILQAKLENHSSEIIKAWLRVAFAALQPRGVVPTEDPEVFLIPVGFDFSQGPFSPLFAARPGNFNKLFAKAALLREYFGAKLADDFECLAARIFNATYREQGLKLQRPDFKYEFKLEGIVGWLANLRLAIRLKRRTQRSALEAGDGEHVHEKYTAVNWHLLLDDSNRDYVVLEDQSLTSLASQADLLPDLGSYPTIARKLQSVLANFNQAHSDFVLTDKQLVAIIICLLKKNKFVTFRKAEQRLDLASCDDFSATALKRFIVALTCLLFVIEVQRHPAALAMHILMLDLIKERKMTFEEAFTEEMPMAMEGAVAVARHLQAKHREASFHPYSYPGASKSSSAFVTKESALVDKWLGVFAATAQSDHEKMTAVCERVQKFCAG